MNRCDCRIRSAAVCSWCRKSVTWALSVVTGCRKTDLILSVIVDTAYYQADVNAR